LGSGDVQAHPRFRLRNSDDLSTDKKMAVSRCCGTGFYNLGMASTKTPAQIKTDYVRLMGPKAGEAFAELMQDAARLHLKMERVPFIPEGVAAL